MKQEHYSLNILAYLLDFIRQMRAGAKVNTADDYGLTALTWALIEGNLDIVKLLLENGADVNATDNKGRSVLTWVKEKGKPATIELLEKHGAKE